LIRPPPVSHERLTLASTINLSSTTLDNRRKNTRGVRLQLPSIRSVTTDAVELARAKQTQKGPEIRTGNTPGDVDIPFKAGLELNITTDDKYATASDDKNL